MTTSYGFRYAAVRRPIKNASTHNYVRVTQYIAPYTSLIPPNNMYNVASVIVPNSDTSTSFYFIAWGGAACPSTAEWRKFNCTEPGIDVDEQWRPWRSIDNWFGQDRQAMKLDPKNPRTAFMNKILLDSKEISAPAHEAPECLSCHCALLSAAPALACRF